MPDHDPTPQQIWAYRGGRVLQVLGLIIGLEALLIYGNEVSEGPMIYTSMAALAVFYLGAWLTGRIKK